jgi:5'-nucleotidase
MRILVTNDDGIHGPGLLALEEIAQAISDDVWVVAPDEERSGAGHSLTLSHPLRSRKLAERRFEVSGTPADCVTMAIRKVLPGMPDLVLSGVNRGQNIADDVIYSGTVAAAMAATSLGLKAIALSQVTGQHGNGDSFSVARKHGSALVQSLLTHDFGSGVLININFPDCRADEVRGIEITRQGKRDKNVLHVDERVDARGFPYYWLAFGREQANPPLGTDIWAVFNKRISVTPLHMNLTQMDQLDGLRAVFGGSSDSYGTKF